MPMNASVRSLARSRGSTSPRRAPMARRSTPPISMRAHTIQAGATLATAVLMNRNECPQKKASTISRKASRAPKADFTGRV